MAIDLTTDENYARLATAGFDYVYLGAHANPGPGMADHIDPGPLRSRADLFHVVYEQDGVTIFAFGPAP
jgi:hypothetical protein